MKFNTTRYTICSDKLNPEADGYRIAVLSDLHDTRHGENNEYLFDAINKENPDIVIIAGDLVTAKSGRDFSPALKLLERLGERWSVYYGLGNHEQRLKNQYFCNDYMQKIEAIPGVTVLDNASAVTAKNIKITGLSLHKRFYAKGKKISLKNTDLTEAVGAKNDEFTILIAHNPDYFQGYAEWGANLVLAGHLHGGIVRLPIVGGVLSPQVRFFPKYDKGLFKINSSAMVVSAGLGKHTIPIRLWNPAELLIIELRK